MICNCLKVRPNGAGEYSSLQAATMNRLRSRWIGFGRIGSSGRSLAGLRRSYIKLVRLHRVREAYACKRNDDKGNKGVGDEEKAFARDADGRRMVKRGERGGEGGAGAAGRMEVRVKKRESINRGRVTGNRRYRGHRHDDKCLAHRSQLPTCLRGHLGRDGAT